MIHLSVRTLEDTILMMEAEGIAQRDRDAPAGGVTVLPDEETVAFRERAIASAQRLAEGSRRNGNG